MYAGHIYGQSGYGGAFWRSPAITIYGEVEFSISTKYEIHVATREFITEQDDAPRHQPFAGSLDQPLRFRRSLQSSSGFSGFVEADGELIVNNVAGEFDFVPEFYATDGRENEVRVGRVDRPYREWVTVFKGVAGPLHVNESEMLIPLYDYRYKLDQPLQSKTYPGPSDDDEIGIDGTDDLRGRRKPIAFGYVDNITPVLVVPQRQIYQVNDGPIHAVSAVYANGVALVPAGDVATPLLLNDAVVAPGAYITCLDAGLFKINFLLDGHSITCDVEGDASDDGFVGTLGAIIRRILRRSTNIRSDDIYWPDFDRFEVDHGYEVGFYADHNDDFRVDQTIELLIGSGAYIGFRRNGKLGIGRFALAEGPPAMRFGRSDIREIRRERLPSDLSPPPWKWRVPYARNWTVQAGTQVAGSVTEQDPDRAAWLAEPLRWAVAESNGVRTNHPFAAERDAGGFLRNEIDAQVEADRLLALYTRSSSLYRMMLGLRPLGLEIGHVIEVTHDRWDLKGGRLLRVVGITEDAASGSVEVVGFG